MFLFPIRNQLNNGILNSQKAMPLKDNNANGDSNYSLVRHRYIESVGATHTVSEWKQKKFMGNRDSSSVTEKRKMNELGVGALNASKIPMTLANTTEKNTRIDAITRVRAGGYVVPNKVTQKYMNK